MKGCFEGIQLLDSFSQSSCNANHHAFLFFVKNKAKKRFGYDVASDFLPVLRTY